jgi:hypothetical protein
MISDDNNYLRDVAWRTPLEYQFTPKSSLHLSNFVLTVELLTTTITTTVLLLLRNSSIL